MHPYTGEKKMSDTSMIPTLVAYWGPVILMMLGMLVALYIFERTNEL